MLYIMRHGRTDWNERHKLQGRTDIPLNDDVITLSSDKAIDMIIGMYSVLLLAADTRPGNG